MSCDTCGSPNHEANSAMCEGGSVYCAECGYLPNDCICLPIPTLADIAASSDGLLHIESIQEIRDTFTHPNFKSLLSGESGFQTTAEYVETIEMMSLVIEVLCLDIERRLAVE